MSPFRPRVLAVALAFAATGAFAQTNERGIDAQNFDERRIDGRVHRFLSAREPAKYRVDGPVSNLSAFASAFACSPAQPMARTGQQRVVIW